MPGRIDPWMWGRLRLADRQGLLSGRHLSPVQSMGLQIVMAKEEADALDKEAEDELARRALTSMARSKGHPAPDEYGEMVVEEVTEENWDVPAPPGAVEVWRMPEPDDEVLQMMERMASGEMTLPE